MPEYDAFGREIGDDPLKNLREATNPVPVEPEPAPAEAEPVVVATEPEPEPERIAIPRPEFVRPRRRRGGLAGLLVLGAIVAGIGLAATTVVNKGEDLIDRIAPGLPDADADAEPVPVGLEANSLIRESNYAAALKTLADSGLGRPTTIRLAPERLDAQLVKGGKLHIVQVTPDGELRDFGVSDGVGRPMAYATLDPSAPERLVRRGANGRNPPRSINYLVISPGPPLMVNAYFKRGRIVLGDAHGKPQRVL